MLVGEELESTVMELIINAGESKSCAMEALRAAKSGEWDKVDELLITAGSDREHILSATIYLNKMADFKEMNAVWDAWVPEGHAPARACVEAAMARDVLLVEISVVAAEK